MNTPTYCDYCPFCNRKLKSTNDKYGGIRSKVCKFCFYDKDKTISRYEIWTYYPQLAYLEQFIIDDYCVRSIYDDDKSSTDLFRMVGAVLIDRVTLPLIKFDLKAPNDTLKKIKFYFTFS